MTPIVIWNDANIAHVAAHSITPFEFEEVLLDDALPTVLSRSSGRPMKFGNTSTGKHICVVWVEVKISPLTLLPVTAYDAPKPRNIRRRGRKK